MEDRGVPLGCPFSVRTTTGVDERRPCPTVSRSEQFATLVATQPENELFRFSLAQALLGEGRPADALEHLGKCAAQKPDWMMPRILLGKTLVGLGRKDEARPWLEAALRLAVAQEHDDPAHELRALLSEL
ncbi:MAG: tetratricopeptide repeat protein [Opitutae bacterium]|nr:tetratricopeptide repeat protein [Opitutae bacterium]